MASRILQTETLVPAHLLPTRNGFTITASNSYGGLCKPGDLLACDRDKLPAYGDIMVMVPAFGAPFARKCSMPAFGPRVSGYSFGHEHGGDVCVFRSDDYEAAGVVVGFRDKAGQWHEVAA